MAKASRVKNRDLDARDASVRSRVIADSAKRQRDPELFDDPFPERVEPCLATLVDKPPEGERWWHEIKWDGYRLIASVRDGDARLATRNGHDWTARFPPIASAMRKLSARSAILDGEAVVLDESGVPSFSALQAALGSRKGPGDKAAHEAAFHAFDLLYLDGQDIRREPLETRKAALAALLSVRGQEGTIRYSEHIEGAGEAMFRHACLMGLEGIVSKRRDRPYRSGRSDDWFKTKCLQREAFVVLGYMPSTVALGGLGALLLGRQEGERRVYVGRVGTGFTEASARELRARFDPLRIDKPDVDVPRELRRGGVVWIRAEFMAEVTFRGWTSDSLLRHTSFRGLVED